MAVVEESAKIRSKLYGGIRRLISIPKYWWWKLISFNAISVKGWQRWEYGFKIHFSGGRVIMGKNCCFRHGVRFRLSRGGVLQLGNKVFMSNNVNITARYRIIIGNKVAIAPNVLIIDHDHIYPDRSKGYKNGEIVIEDNVWIGANVVILRNTHIGANSVIAAGCVVKGDVPPNTVYGGTTARELKRF